jgi:hypothetical protein
MGKKKDRKGSEIKEKTVSPVFWVPSLRKKMTNKEIEQHKKDNLLKNKENGRSDNK